MTDAWTLTTQEMRLLWPDAEAEWPMVLAAGYGSHHESADDQRRSDAQVLSRLRAEMTPRKKAAIEVLASPTVAVSLNWVDARKPADPAGVGRVHSGMRPGSEVYVASQAPTSVLGEGGPVTITMTSVGGWTRHLVGLLPTSPGAGKRGADPAVPIESIPVGESRMQIVAADPSVETAAAAFASGASVSTAARFTVVVSDPRDRLRSQSMVVLVNDVVGDGRYALLMDTPAYATAASDEDVAKLLNRVINMLMSRQEQSA